MRVDSLVAESAHRLLNCLFEKYNQVWVDSLGLQKIDLGLILGEAIKDPAVYAAVSLSEALVDKSENDFIRNIFTVSERRLDL